MEEIFEDEITTFKSLPVSEVLTKLNTIEKSNLLVAKEELYDDDGNVKKEIIDVLKDIDIEIEDRKFFDKSKTIKKLVKISEFKEIVKKYDSTLKTFKEILNEENGTIKDEYIEIAKKESLEINLDKNIKIYNNNKVSYKEISDEKIVELLNKKVILNLTKKSDLFIEEDGLKILDDKYKEILEQENITYDDFEGEFYDESIELVKKLLILIPERYFRNSLEEHLSLEEFSNKNNELLKGTIKEIIYKDNKVDKDVLNIINEILKEIAEEKVSLEIGGENDEPKS